MKNLTIISVFLIILSILFFSGCQNLKYVDDIAFINSANAGYENLPVYINGVPCLDMDGIPGRCSKAIDNSKSLSFKIPKRPYSYNYSLSATTGVKRIIMRSEGNEDQIFYFPNIKFDVQKDSEIEIIIEPDSFIPLFMVVGRISPDDRPENISALFRALITVYDKEYSEREAIYHYKKYLVFGENALYSSVIFNDGSVKNYKKKTALKISENDYKVAFSESYNMRFNMKVKK